jgi:hypothetical protein
MYNGPILVADAPSYIPGLLTLIGSVLGAVVAISLAILARQAARRNWLNDQRQDVYPKFIAAGQAMLEACDSWPLSGKDRAAARNRLYEGYRTIGVHNAVIQSLGKKKTIKEARLHMYTLLKVMDIRLKLEQDPEDRIEGYLGGARESRHRVLVAMRRELKVRNTRGLLTELRAPLEPLWVAPELAEVRGLLATAPEQKGTRCAGH